MNGHLKLVSVVVMAVWLAIPCQAQSGHFDALRNSSPNSGNQGITVTIQVPEGILRDNGFGGSLRQDERAIVQPPELTLDPPYTYGAPPNQARALSITVRFLLYTGKTTGDLSIPDPDAWHRNMELAVAISPSPGDSLAGPPVLTGPGYVSHGLPKNGLVRTRPAVQPGTSSRCGGPDSGKIELTVLKSYANSDTGSDFRLLDREPKGLRKSSMKISSDAE